jgi:glycosyltransferase involved in cell wall biosynthesis
VTLDARAAVPGLPVATVENGVDLLRFSPDGPVADIDAMAGAPAVARRTVRVGLVGTYAKWKGHDVFFSALSRLAHVPLQAYVVGGPVYDTADSQWRRDDLERMADQAGIRSRIRLVPFCADVSPIMRSLDVIVHASTAPEPFGLVIAEAMCTGRAVVVSAAGGAAGLVRPGVDALTHEAGDAAGLAAAIERLVTDGSTRTRIAAAARDAGARRFDSARAAADMLRVYRRVLTPSVSAAAAL